MKKLAFALILVGLLIFTGCAGSPVEPAPSATPTPTTAAPTSAPTSTPTPTPTPEPTSTTTATPTATPTPTSAPEPTEEPEPEPAPITGGGVFTIVPRESVATYNIDESFDDEMVTLIGTTSKISGDFTALYADPAAATMGPIVIEADSFKGQGRFARTTRDSNINLLILHTFKYKFITFTPTVLEGLPEHLAVGDNITFSIIGDLTIRDITNSETFSATMNVVSEDRLEGSITTTILRDTYSLISFRLPSNVAEVAEEIVLTVDLVAVTS